TRVLPREPYDFPALLDRWNRRRQMRSMTARGYSPWQSDAGRAATPVQLSEREKLIFELRSQISRALAAHQPDVALESYHQLVDIDPDQTLPRQAQLDIANYAMNAGEYQVAAHAYERFLVTYRADEFVPQVQLILGLIYARYLDARDRARPLL